MLAVLAWRDIAVRYKQTVVGVAWALLQPLLAMLIMTLVFGRMAGLPSEAGAPYAIMVFAALLPWQLFAGALTNAGQSLVGNAGMISKIYFPRVIIPVAAVAVAIADFLVSLAILGGLMAWFRFLPNLRLLALPIFAGFAVLAALGPGLLVTALMVRYRDFRYIVPFLVQFGMYLSPVAYSASLIREKFGEGWFLAYCLNPLVGVIEGFRWAILGGEASFLNPGTALSLAVSALAFVIGLAVFRRTERSFADII